VRLRAERVGTDESFDRASALLEELLSRLSEPGLRLATVAAVAGCAPFVGGFIVFIVSRIGPASTVAGLAKCPTLTLTGYPCPSCGGTRAFASVAARDGQWREYNGPLVLYAAALAASAAVLVAVPRGRRNAIAEALRRHQGELREHPFAMITALIVLAIPPWRAAMRSARGQT
jgi:zinc transporter ZupT